MSRDGFDTFCASVLARPAWPGDIPPAELAADFVRHFMLTGFPSFKRLRSLVEESGVGTVVESALPDRLRGIHTALRNEPYTIEYRDDEWERARDHTVLHEAYEILLEKFQDLCPSYVAPTKPELCHLADRFAAAVLMQPRVFRLFAQASGLDVIALQKSYRRSYASVAMRLVEVMRLRHLIVAIYERRDGGHPAEWPEQVGPESFALSLALPNFPSARNGDQPPAGSAARRVIELRQPVYVDRVSGFEPPEIPDLTVIARPVF